MGSRSGNAIRSTRGRMGRRGDGGCGIMRFFQVTQISFKLISIKSQTLYHNGSFAVWRTTLANSFDLQEHVLPSALNMEVNMWFHKKSLIWLRTASLSFASLFHLKSLKSSEELARRNQWPRRSKLRFQGQQYNKHCHASQKMGREYFHLEGRMPQKKCFHYKKSIAHFYRR